MKYVSILVALLASVALAIPTAQEAQRQSIITRDVKVHEDVVKLLGEVDKAIAEAIHYGSTDCNLEVTQYREEAVHRVNEKLRKLGYKVEVVRAIFGYGFLDVISWDVK